jgi:signal recognition particle receptor subunit beta
VTSTPVRTRRHAAPEPPAVTWTVPAPTAPAPGVPLKVVVAGGRAVGKTTFVANVSDLPAGVGSGLVDYGRAGGRIAADRSLDVHLYGMPPQNGYWFMWDSLARGAVAALVLADAERLADCFPALDYLEHRRMPFLVAVAAGRQPVGVPDLREALAVSETTPVVLTDAADRRGADRRLLSMLVRHALTGRGPAVPAA